MQQHRRKKDVPLTLNDGKDEWNERCINRTTIRRKGTVPETVKNDIPNKLIKIIISKNEEEEEEKKTATNFQRKDTNLY